jgi:leucyl aminopeptidase
MQPLDRLLLPASTAAAIPIRFCTRSGWPELYRSLEPLEAAQAKAQGFTAAPATHLLITDSRGAPASVLYASDAKVGEPDPFQPARLLRLLPPGRYRLDATARRPELIALGWLLESYAFDRYRKAEARALPALVCPAGADRKELLRIAEAVHMARDLINTPSSDMGPAELEAAAAKLARAHGARFKVTRGETLRRQFPMIHAVGQASARLPRLIEFTWGRPGDSRVSLVGKGVCFDTGGLDIKPASGMALMKKDMGGAAGMLALARMLMSRELPVRLRVLIPAVDNAIAGNAFRPGDVLKARNGTTVEIGNTDAEGRLILADALALADHETPDVLIDMATLTGAARVALGPDLAPFYVEDDQFAADLVARAADTNDPVWRMPMWHAYRRLIESKVADINNSSETGFAGSITAALFLRHFVKRARIYAHFDIFAWTPVARPGRPFGGEVQAARALYALLCARYG